MEEIDIWRTATEMIQKFGAEAGLIAGMRGDALLEQGDGPGFQVWVRVVAAINELERTSPPSGVVQTKTQLRRVDF